jgi:type I restriction enzyme S subunit
MPLPIPNSEILSLFTERAKAFYTQSGALERENNELTTLRDFLLPLLMNGQVRVGEKAREG